MSKENLNGLGVKQLRELAKEKNISGRWNMTKAELVDAIFGAMNAEDGDGKQQSAKDEVKIESDQGVEDGIKAEKTTANAKIDEPAQEMPDIDMAQKMPYIENAEIGTLVAFRLSNGKVKSAKIVRKSSKNRKLKLETEYHAEYIVSYDDVIWVRTGARWPRGVYKMLKGTVNDSGSKEQKAEAE